MKTILINPYQDFLETGIINRCVPPLDLAYLAALLRKDCETEIIDANALKIDHKNELWEKIKADVFIITTAPLDRWECPNLKIENIKAIIKAICENNKQSKILVIGPHATHNPEEFTAIGKNITVIQGEPEA